MRERWKNTGKLSGIDRKGFSSKSRGRERGNRILKNGRRKPPEGSKQGKKNRDVSREEW